MASRGNSTSPSNGGGAIATVAETNDIGFLAVTVPEGKSVEPGVYFRVQLAGITGHEQFATDAGILIPPADCITVAAAMVRVFVENGDRTNRKKARLKYLIDKWGIPKFLEETEKKLAFPLTPFALKDCVPPAPPIPHAHIGVWRQSQPHLNYVGVVTPVGTMTSRQMHRLANLATAHGSGTLRLTVWQNVLIPDVSDGFVETVKRSLVRMGFHHEATAVLGGLVACTGSMGCKWAQSATKAQGLELANYLQKKLTLDQPINIHLTGCPNSCAQHYIGDIGLVGTQVTHHGEKVDGYHVVLGGRSIGGQTIGRQIFTGIPFVQIPTLLEGVLRTYLDQREGQETFVDFATRQSVKDLQELFTN